VRCLSSRQESAGCHLPAIGPSCCCRTVAFSSVHRLCGAVPPFVAWNCCNSWCIPRIHQRAPVPLADHCLACVPFLSADASSASRHCSCGSDDVDCRLVVVAIVIMCWPLASPRCRCLCRRCRRSSRRLLRRPVVSVSVSSLSRSLSSCRAVVAAAVVVVVRRLVSSVSPPPAVVAAVSCRRRGCHRPAPPGLGGGRRGAASSWSSSRRVAAAVCCRRRRCLSSVVVVVSVCHH
jgi:hypothetical protein